MRCDFRTIETPLCSIQRVWERVWREKNESWLDFFLFPCWPLLHSDLSIWLTVSYCIIIINDTKQKSHFKNQRYNIKARRWSDTLTTNLQLLLFTFFRFCHQTGTNSVFLVWYSWLHKWTKSSKNNFRHGRNWKLYHRPGNGNDWTMPPGLSPDFSKFTLRKSLFYLSYFLSW